MDDRIERLEAEIEALKRDRDGMKAVLGLTLASVSTICLKIPSISFAMHSNDAAQTEQRIDEFLELIRKFDATVDKFFIDSGEGEEAFDE